MTELKPCPFCGNKVNYRLMYGDIPGFLCEFCGAVVSFRIFGDPKEAWNKRMSDDEH